MAHAGAMLTQAVDSYIVIIMHEPATAPSFAGVVEGLDCKVATTVV